MEHRQNYGLVTIALHWATALLIFANLALGHIMVGAPLSSKPVLVPLHAWIGLTVLFFTLFRIFWRMGHPKPPYPEAFKRYEIRLATWVQVFFYGLMIGLPVAGYLILSANPPNPARHLTFWGTFQIPFLPYLQNLDRPVQILTHDRLVAAHALSAWLIIAVIALHLLGVVKHHLLDKSPIIRRMLPNFRH